MVRFPQCTECKNYIGQNNENKNICKAFPNGINDDIFWGIKSHKEPIDGDNGIVFEQCEL